MPNLTTVSSSQPHFYQEVTTPCDSLGTLDVPVVVIWFNLIASDGKCVIYIGLFGVATKAAHIN